MASHWSLQNDASYLGSHYPVPTSVCWALPSLSPQLCPEGPSSLLSALALTGKHLSRETYSLPGPKVEGISGTDLLAPAPPAPRLHSSLLGALYTLHHMTGYLRKGPWMLLVLLEARGMCSEYSAKNLKQKD